MKKFIKNISCFVFVLAVCFTFVTVTSAKSIEMTISYNQNVMFVKSDTDKNLETVVKAYDMNVSAIKFENTIQRKVRGSIYRNVGQRKFEVNATGIQFKQIYENVEGGTMDTRTIWVDQTPDSTIHGRFYINNYVG